MPSNPQAFRLTTDDDERLSALADELNCSRAEVVRTALVALRVAMADGYDFNWVRGPGLVLRTERQGNTRTTTWFQLGEGDKLTQIGQQTADD